MARTKDFDEDTVLNKAVCLFWHKGYHGTSMQDLVDELGISRSSLYDTYADKHSLYLKALQFYLDSAGKRMDDLLVNAKTSTAAIRQILELTTLDLLNDKQRKGCFMVNAEVEVAPHDADVKKIIIKSEVQIEDAFRRAIQNGQKNGEINSKKDARALARFFLNTVKGIRVSAKSVDDKSTFDDVIETALSVLN